MSIVYKRVLIILPCGTSDLTTQVFHLDKLSAFCYAKKKRQIEIKRNCYGVSNKQIWTCSEISKQWHFSNRVHLLYCAPHQIIAVEELCPKL